MSIKIASWNVRGFNDPSKHKEIFGLVHKVDIKIMSIWRQKLKLKRRKALLQIVLKFGIFCLIHNQIYMLGYGSAGTQIFVKSFVLRCLISFCFVK